MESVRIVRPERRRSSGEYPRNLRNRITCAYTPAERAAIEFLNRTPRRDDIPPELERLRGKPRRTIAKELSAPELAALVSLHAGLIGSR